MTPWWQPGVIYHVYPRSFADADGDGIGDLRGITGRLDHLVWLGVDAVWLSPIYLSPMKDFGYDITDHTAIDPRFGSLTDFDTLIDAAHERGLRVLLDFVPNHTSDEHPWFAESRDFYLWRDPAADGGPPNNWLSVFGGPAWTLDAGRDQYYSHAYLREQPDLDWRNPAVRGLDQRVEVGERAEARIDRGVVRDVVAEVLHRRPVDRRQPDGVDAEPREVVEPAGQASQVADAVAVGVRERARVDLVDDRRLPPRLRRRGAPGLGEALVQPLADLVGLELGVGAVSYTHLTLPTTPYV